MLVLEFIFNKRNKSKGEVSGGVEGVVFKVWF